MATLILQTYRPELLAVFRTWVLARHPPDADALLQLIDARRRELASSN